MTQNNLCGGRDNIGGGNYYRLIETDVDQAQKEAERLRQETDARVTGRIAVGMTLFAFGGGANLMPMTEALAVEATIGVTEIADKHKTSSALGSIAADEANKSTVDKNA